MKNRNKLFTSIAILGSAIFGMVLTAGTGVFEALGIFSRTTTGAKPINVVLDESNAYSSGTSQTINTTFGENPIVFDYSGCSSAQAKTHVYMPENATVGNYYKANNKSLDINWNNKLTSIESIKAVFNADSGASLQFRASYDGKTSGGTWGEFAPLTSNTSFALASNPYYIELKAVGGSVSLTSCEICFSCVQNTSASGTPKYETQVSVNGGESRSYGVDKSFDSLIPENPNKATRANSDKPLDIKVTLSDGSQKTLYKGEFTYTVTNSSGSQITTSEPFGTAGKYTAHIKYGSLATFDYQFDVAANLVESITLPNTFALNTGASATLSYTVLPSNATNKTLSWTSSNTNVATVDQNGHVTSIAAGTTIITAAATDTSNVSSSCTVNVSNVAVTSVSLDKHSLTMYVGDSDETLTATVLPENATNKNVAWSSNNPSAATIVNGVIHAVAPGEARIRVSAGANTEIYDDCIVTVKSSSEKPISIALTTWYYNEDELSTTSGGSAVDTQNALPLTTLTGSSVDKSYIVSEISGTNAYHPKNGGLCIGTTSAAGSLTYKIFDSYPVSKVVLYGAYTQVGNEILLNGNTSDSGSLTSKAAELSTISEPLVWDNLNIQSSNGYQNLVFNTSTGKDKRVTIYVLEIYINITPVVPKPVTNIDVSLDSSSIYAGSSTGATAIITPDDADNQNVEWRSSNEDVATVNNKGIVTGVSQGTANIIATSAENSTISGFATITVTPKPVVHVTSLTVTPDTLDLSPGKSADLSVSIEPNDADNQNVTWSGSANGITVDSAGHISVSDSATIGATATITARSDDTSSASGTCVVTVVEEALSGTATIVPSDLLTSYPTSEDDFEKDGITFTAYNAANINSQGYLQFKKEGGYIANKTAINGLQSITLNRTNHSTNNSFSGTIEYGSSYDSDGYNISMSVSEGNTYKFPSGTSFFKIFTGKYAGYLSSINLTYSTKQSKPSAISIPLSAEVGIGSTTTLTATYTPADANVHTDINWTSSNNNVATVDANGKVTGVSAGTATITATLKDEGYTSIYAECAVTVKAIAVTGVSLDKTSVNLSINGQTTLTETVSPSNATNKSVTWTSSNNNVATVSNGVVTAVGTGTATITVKTVDGNKSATCSVNVSEIQKDKWTILIYMCGADLESNPKGGGYATGDITEMLSVRNQPSDVNIVLQTGGANTWKKYNISSQYNQRYHIENKSLICDNSQVYSRYQSMGESNTLKDFITWGLETYPADKTGLILWNHGGALRGVCYDEKADDDNLTDNEVRTAVSGALSATGTSGKLEFIGYDACLMAVQDIADFNAPYFNYMVCSEESEAGAGWDYDTWLDDVYSNQSTTTILKAICDGFIRDNGGVNASGNNWQGDEGVYYEPANQTLSYLNLSYAEAYKTAFEAMASQLKSKISSGGASGFRNDIIGKTYCFSYDYETNDPYLDYYGLIDVQHFLEVLKASSKYNPGDTYVNNTLTALHNLVAYSTSQQEGAHDAHGLALTFVGGTGYKLQNYVTSTYSNFTNWISINSSYKGDVNYTYRY